ncbi:hypothetical protein SLA2020_377020 [Shorea laevis]
MACSSSARTWKLTTRRRDSTSLTTKILQNTSTFLFYSPGPIRQSKRHNFPIFSSDPLFSSSFRSSSCSNSQKKYVKYVRIHNGSLSDMQNDETRNIVEKLVVKKQPLWSRILFESKKMRSIMLLNLITIVYASDIPVVKTVETMMDPAAFSAVRFVMSAIPFLPFVIRARGDVQTRNAGVELGFWVSLGYLVEALALLTADAGRASFISLFTVIVVPLLDGMLGAIIPARTWFGVLMSAIGVAMLECSGSPPNVGDLLNFLSAIFFGIHMLRTEHISRNTKKENFLALLGYEVCVVALLSTFWVLIGGWFDGFQDSETSTWTWPVFWDWMVAFPWIPALYTGTFSTGLCLWVEIAAMRDVSATETAIIYGMEPFWGAGFAWFLLGERWGTSGWIGAVLVLGGSLMVQIFGSSTPSRPTETAVGNQKGDLLLVPDNDEEKLQNTLSPAPVVVRSKGDVMDWF